MLFYISLFIENHIPSTCIDPCMDQYEKYHHIPHAIELMHIWINRNLFWIIRRRQYLQSKHQ